jgi:hypothetical protein
VSEGRKCNLHKLFTVQKMKEETLLWKKKLNFLYNAIPFRWQTKSITTELQIRPRGGKATQFHSEQSNLMAKFRFATGGARF